MKAQQVLVLLTLFLKLTVSHADSLWSQPLEIRCTQALVWKHCESQAEIQVSKLRSETTEYKPLEFPSLEKSKQTPLVEFGLIPAPKHESIVLSDYRMTLVDQSSSSVSLPKGSIIQSLLRTDQSILINYKLMY